MTLFSKVWKRLDKLIFGRGRTLAKAAESLRDIALVQRLLLEKTTENLSAATQVLVRAMGAFERSDMAFAEIGSMADKMKGREAALEEALISIGKLKVEEAKVKGLEAEELKLNLAAKPYDDKF